MTPLEKALLGALADTTSMLRSEVALRHAQTGGRAPYVYERMREPRPGDWVFEWSSLAIHAARFGRLVAVVRGYLRAKHYLLEVPNGDPVWWENCEFHVVPVGLHHAYLYGDDKEKEKLETAREAWAAAALERHAKTISSKKDEFRRVIAEALRECGPCGPWRIARAGHPGTYWSALDGWVGTDAGDYFLKEEPEWFKLPAGGVWESTDGR